jgi:hypothetical protein
MNTTTLFYGVGCAIMGAALWCAYRLGKAEGCELGIAMTQLLLDGDENDQLTEMEMRSAYASRVDCPCVDELDADDCELIGIAVDYDRHLPMTWCVRKLSPDEERHRL